MDEHLLVRLKQNDDEAFTEIYDRYWDKLLFIGVAKLGEFHVAEELVQDIFLDIWQRRSQLEITGSLEAYLAVSMKYRVINALVRKKRRLAYERELRVAGTDADYGTQQWLSFDELRHRLKAHVERLPERCRMTFELSRNEGLSNKEIAAAMNISEKSVESNLTRALRTLRNLVTHCFSFFF